MKKNPSQEITEILTVGDSNETPFAETKIYLLSKGYSETEINHALYQNSYDGKKNVIQPEDSATKAFKENPELSEKIGENILEDHRKNEMTKTIATGAAGRFAPGRHAQSKYTFDFFERLGLPYFSIFFGSLVIFILVIKFNLPTIINNLVSVLVLLWIIWALYRNYSK
jgi:hypothetical protein